MEAVKKEVAVDRVKVKIDVDAVFAPSCYVLYLMDNFSGITVRNRQHKLCAEEKQRTVIMSILYNPRRNLYLTNKAPLRPTSRN